MFINLLDLLENLLIKAVDSLIAERERSKPDTQRQTCKFFLQDKCRYGDSCNLLHPRGSKRARSPSPKRSRTDTHRRHRSFSTIKD